MVMKAFLPNVVFISWRFHEYQVCRETSGCGEVLHLIGKKLSSLDVALLDGGVGDVASANDCFYN